MLITAGMTLILAFFTWYFILIPINIRSQSFWFFIAFILIVFNIINKLRGSYKTIKSKEKASVNKEKKGVKLILLLPIFIIIGSLVLSLFSSKLFNSRKYSKMIEIESGNFLEDIKEISFDQIPTVDRITAIKLGDRKMGEMLELASQFNVSDAYTQIDYRDKAVRVTPLKYNGILKWLNNKSEGIPGYITVDMATGQTSLNKLDENIRYSKSDKFNRDIRRNLRFKYPTRIFYDISFEIDEDGKPYWIAATYKKNIGIFGGLDVDTVLIANAVDGSVKEYSIQDVPSWVDRVYDADIIINQINNWGSLKGGFLNSIFSQKGVLVTTKGYNYLAIDDDVFLYTGVTSASKDSSNMGFILSNLRTKETKFYEMSSADEISAMESAQGEVQEKQYISTFPILLNIGDKPTYMMALKDNAELIKAYALVDAQNYQNVEVGSSLEETLKKYGVDSDLGKTEEELIYKKLENIIIENMVIDGNTHFYILADGEIYTIKGSEDQKLPFIENGESLEIKYYKNKQNKNIIKEIN